WLLANNVVAREAAASSRPQAIFATSSGIQRAAKGAIPALKQTMARIDFWRKSNREGCVFVTGWSRLGALIAVYPPLHKPYGMTYLTLGEASGQARASTPAAGLFDARTDRRGGAGAGRPGGSRSAHHAHHCAPPRMRGDDDLRLHRR